ncbi:MAG: AAA family ATPase [Planctomycetota bacterium]
MGRFRTAEFHQDYLIEDILPAGQPAIISGPRKTLKTSIMLDAALSIATGTRFLGTFAVKEAKPPVWVVSAESGGFTLQETMKRICRTKGITGARDESTILFSTRKPNLTNSECLNEIRRTIIEHGIAFAAFDPAYQMFPGIDAANLFSVGELLGELSDICNETGCTPFALSITRERMSGTVVHAIPRNWNPSRGAVSRSGLVLGCCLDVGNGTTARNQANIAFG